MGECEAMQNYKGVVTVRACPCVWELAWRRVRLEWMVCECMSGKAYYFLTCIYHTPCEECDASRCSWEPKSTLAHRQATNSHGEGLTVV